MKANRIVRILIGLFVLAVFLCYAYVRAAYTPKSDDLYHGNYEQYLQEHGQAPVYVPEETGGNQLPEIAVPQEAITAAEPAAVETPEQAPAPEPTVDPASPYGQALANAAARGLPAPPNVDVTSWEFVLVNGDHSIGDYAPEQLAYMNQTLSETDIQYAYNGYRCPVDARIADALLAFGLGCKAEGLSVYLSSGYRSYSDQAANFQRICQNNGITDGKDASGHYITMPAGCSEHQLALCCDITDKYYEIKNSSIEQTSTYQWLVQHCAEYGFVHRFPSGKEDITGVMYEPWHFRYVGQEAAAYMMANDLCLEEFLALYGVV